MVLIEFIFFSFWHFAGVCVLLFIICDTLDTIVKNITQAVMFKAQCRTAEKLNIKIEQINGGTNNE